jgi:hypothetical protein
VTAIDVTTATRESLQAEVEHLRAANCELVAQLFVAQLVIERSEHADSV